MKPLREREEGSCEEWPKQGEVFSAPSPPSPTSPHPASPDPPFSKSFSLIRSLCTDPSCSLSCILCTPNSPQSSGHKLFSQGSVQIVFWTSRVFYSTLLYPISVNIAPQFWKSGRSGSNLVALQFWKSGLPETPYEKKQLF